MRTLSITVSERAGTAATRPVSGGVPLPEGAAPAGSGFALVDAVGEAVELQHQILATWKDGSARWVLLDFMLTPKPGTAPRFDLVYGTNVSPDTPPAAPVPLSVSRCGNDIELPGLGTLALTVVDRDGTPLTAVFPEERIEVQGPVRTTSVFHGSIRDSAGDHLLQVRLRVSRYAETGALRLEPLVLIDSPDGILQCLREIRLDLPLPAGNAVELGGTGWQQVPETPVRLFQLDDESWRLEGADGSGTRAPGWLRTTGAKQPLALAMRSFRQQWPKSLETAPGRISVGLLPAFRQGDFDHMTPWFKHQYLFEDGCYRLRTGQSRRWEIWLQQATDGEDLCRAVNAPLVPAPAPDAALATGVWGSIAPAGIPRMTDYDPWAERLFDDYCKSIETERDYGAMNWGDWFGERKVNWGNHEYDTVNQLLIQFARTGNPDYFFVADAAARHSTEVDVVHAVNEDLAEYFNSNWGTKGYPPRPGMVHEHSVGHVGSFYPVETIRKLFVDHGIGHNDHPYLCLDPFNLGHVWTQGMVKYYFLTGDPFVKETAELIGSNLAKLVEDGEYSFGIDDPHFGRAAGWPLLALAGAYELEFDSRYLSAMKNLVERALDRQDPHCGGWLYQLYPGHCLCTTRKHVGMAGFITSILVNGLSEYYHLTGDERIPDAVDRAVTFLTNDTWDDHRAGWRYTSCPASAFTGQAGVTVMAMVNAVRLSQNPEHRRVLKKAWEAKFQALLKGQQSGPGQGKAFTSTLYGCAEAAGLLAADL